MWKTKRNVKITYKPLSSQKLEDIVSYQPISSDKQKTVLGVDTVGKNTGEWDWRGKGWLMIASSHWEVLGWGELEGGAQWVVTYFAETLFTPAGVDIYSRAKRGCGDEVVKRIKDALRGIEDERMGKLTAELFEVARD
ncbi:MAG: hypothetical protein Q9163_004281 [Psora crenata]